MGDAKDRGGDKMLSGWPRILLGRMLKELGGQDLSVDSGTPRKNET